MVGKEKVRINGSDRRSAPGAGALNKGWKLLELTWPNHLAAASMARMNPGPRGRARAERVHYALFTRARRAIAWRACLLGGKTGGLPALGQSPLGGSFIDRRTHQSERQFEGQGRPGHRRQPGHRRGD